MFDKKSYDIIMFFKRNYFQFKVCCLIVNNKMLYINETWPLPKPNKGKHLQLRLANSFDFQSVMMISADVYFGYDYLPYVYNKWILESIVYLFKF